MNKSMRLIAADWNKLPSFKLLPVSISCPYNEVIYDSEQKVLAIISKEHKQGYQMTPKLNDDGLPISLGRNQQGYKQQRVLFDNYYEYYVTNPQDIEELVESLAVNTDHTAFRSFFPHRHSKVYQPGDLGWQGNGASVSPTYQTDIEPNPCMAPLIPAEDPSIEEALDPENAPEEPQRRVTENPDADIPMEVLLENIEKNKEHRMLQEDFLHTVATVQNQHLAESTNEA